MLLSHASVLAASIGDLLDEVKARNGIYEATGGDRLAVTDISSRKPWTKRSIHWWLPGRVKDGRKEGDCCRVFP